MRNGMTFKVKKTWLMYVLCLFLYFRPAQYVIGSFLYRVTSMLVIALFLFLFLWRFLANRRKPSGDIVLMLLAYGWCMIGSTVINFFQGNEVTFSDAIIFYSFIGGLILLSDYGIKKNPKEFLSAFVFVGSIMCTLNALTVFIFRDLGGMNPQSVDAASGRTLSTNYFFLAEDNATFFWSWPVIVAMWLYYFLYVKKGRYKTWLYFVTGFVLASYVYTWSVMAMVAFILLAGLLLIYMRKVRKPKKHRISVRTKISKYLNLYRILFIVSLVLEFLLVVGQISYLFSDLLTGVFDKGVTLSGRTYIWEQAIYYIKQAPLIGYGYEARTVSIAKLWNFNHTHNMWLEILYRGGIIGACLFFIVFWRCGKEQPVASKSMRRKVILAFLYFAVFIFFSATILEFAFYRYMYVVLLVLLIDKKYLIKDV